METFGCLTSGPAEPVVHLRPAVTAYQQSSGRERLPPVGQQQTHHLACHHPALSLISEWGLASVGICTCSPCSEVELLLSLEEQGPSELGRDPATELLARPSLTLP